MDSIRAVSGMLPVSTVIKTTPEKAKNKPEEARSSPNKKEFEAALAEVEKFIQNNSELKIQIDEGTGRTFFRIIGENGKVLLQVPSEEILAMAKKLKDLEKSGLIWDKEG